MLQDAMPPFVRTQVDAKGKLDEKQKPAAKPGGVRAEKPNWTADESRSAEPKSPECGPADINSREPQSALLSQVCSRQAKKSYAFLLVFFLPFGVLVAVAAVSAPPGGAATMSPDSSRPRRVFAASGSSIASAAVAAAAAFSSASVRLTVTSSPRAMRSASSALRATVTVIAASTSGWSANGTLYWPIVLIGALSIICERPISASSSLSRAAMSRVETEPNNWPASLA